MSVVGVDFGTLHSKIGVARNRGIDIIANEVSNRATPSLVAFGQKQRAIGESAKTQETSNFKNTIGSLKCLIVEKKFLNATLVDVGGTVGTQIIYRGEKQTFSATQLVAMYLGKLRDITANELKTAVSDLIAGLNALRLINDTTAVALGYGITKTDLPDPENPRHVMFVDVGHSSMSVSVVAFAKGQLTVKAAAYDRHLGGRDIDYALIQYFADQFNAKYHIDVLSSPKATFRLGVGCEKLKKAPLNVESLMNDIDASSKLNRETYEELISGVLDRIAVPLQQALVESGISIDAIDAVELVGGTTRIPAVRARIQAALGGKTLFTTLNQDEAIARGATFAAAFQSPTFRVREFHVHDIAQYPIKMMTTELVVFPRGNGIPSTKILTFYRKEPFEIDAQYVDPAGLPGGINPWIARFTAEAVPPSSDGDLTCIKLKTAAELARDHVEEREEAMEVDGEAPKKKRVVKKNEIPFSTRTSSLDPSVIEKLKEQEAEMHAADKLVMDTEDRKNALEEYVYDMRAKLDERYSSYVQASEKEKLMGMFQEAEDWLYSEEGEDATKSAYVAKLDTLKAVGDPIVTRYREAEDRPKAMAHLRAALNDYISQATSSDEKFAHISESEKQKVVERCATVQKWLDDQTARQAERPKNVDPVLTSAEILKKREDVVYFAVPILTKVKPKPVKSEGTPSGTPNNGTGTPQSGTQTPDPGAQGPSKGEEEVPGPPEMDVD
ncbi:Hsp70 protein-domain-containing protein [Suillus paluster]|uniref:Hsp70 protein-domain-containing protein n=1 Tax=Suillus paluster TaxID=48578 RepID=UPI001B8786B1|nr:Hsp70 protein-domain-containing protein [Suillus paluster]KAG1751254.1 Hsp70 protein-domain-containing protein [Suillus paluster]